MYPFIIPLYFLKQSLSSQIQNTLVQQILLWYNNNTNIDIYANEVKIWAAII